MHRVELLGSSHDRRGFDCGEPELAQYLQRTARQHLEKGISRTFVLVDDEAPQTLLGFFTLVVGRMEGVKLPPTWTKRYPQFVPGVKLARLAVRLADQGKGFGAVLLIEALRRVVLGAEHIGVAAVFVDAKNDRARAFYEHFGFISLPDNPLELFLPMATVRHLTQG